MFKPDTNSVYFCGEKVSELRIGVKNSRKYQEDSTTRRLLKQVQRYFDEAGGEVSLHDRAPEIIAGDVANNSYAERKQVSAAEKAVRLSLEEKS